MPFKAIFIFFNSKSQEYSKFFFFFKFYIYKHIKCILNRL